MMSSRGMWRSIVVAGLIAVCLMAVGFTVRVRTAGAQDAAAVTIQNFAFSPASLEVAVGTTVTWTNQNSAPHTATADDGSFDTGQLAQGQSGSVTFDTAGTFAYFCAIHPNMRGTITVTAADAAGDDAGNDADAVGDDAGNDAGAGATTTSTLPSSGVGTAAGRDTGAPMTTLAVLIALLAVIGLAAVRLRRRA